MSGYLDHGNRKEMYFIFSTFNRSILIRVVALHTLSIKKILLPDGTHMAAFQNRLLPNSNANVPVANIGSNSLTNSMVNNQMPFGTSSDSESPTEPVSQQTVAMLRARVVPNKM